MLYVPIKVNDVVVKAFVDSGAQSTIISPSCAEACHLSYLIDEDYQGIARGVGTARILGKIHNAKVQIGDAELDCAFTVMEGKSVDLLFGLDNLRRHQACIDLVDNVLRFPHTKVDFLPESEIPKFGFPGPDGTETGAIPGTMRPEDVAKQASQAASQIDWSKIGSASVQSNAAPASSSKQPNAAPSSSSRQSNAATASSSSQSTAARASSSSQSNPGATSAQDAEYSEESVQVLVSMGFPRAEAIQALVATGGNVEYAAGLLFDQ